MIIIYLLLTSIFAVRVGDDAALKAVTDAGFVGASGVAGGFLGFLSTMFNQALIFGGGARQSNPARRADGPLGGDRASVRGHRRTGGSRVPFPRSTARSPSPTC